MAKDPAFLFYPGDYLRDTQCLSEKAQVAYDRIMCEHMRNICEDVSKIGITKDKLNFFTKRLSDDEKNDLMNVLIKINTIYQIEWVAISLCKRKKYSSNRAENRRRKNKSHMNTYDDHMEIEDENENKDENVLKKETQKKNNMSSAKDTENIPLPFEGPEFAQIWKEWLQHRKEARIKNYTPTGLKRLFKWLKETSGEDEKIAILIIDQSLTKGWQGLFELKTLPNAANNTNTASGDKAGKLSRERIQAAKNF
jgi:hypothetical protein